LQRDVFAKLCFGMNTFLLRRVHGPLAPVVGHLLLTALLGSALATAARPAAADDAPATPAAPAPGHSLHGESFSEGPRRRLPLTPGCGVVRFPVTTASPEAQSYFEQGVGQLHGFWYWEAERSFRTVLQIDPACVMAHWGMAMANIQNEARARQIIARATGPAFDAATPREKAWIEAAKKLFAEKKDDAERKAHATEFLAAVEKIALDHPDDLEARAFLVGFSWWNKSRLGLPVTSPLAVDALALQVLAKAPLHPIHHYLIHLWDGSRPTEALRSAAACGQSAPGIAHMWHMPGHSYSELQRWQDAAWQQEAAARVDHAQMLSAHLYPDQIHNFAHNSEWLVRTLNHLGRVREALAIAANLVSMPRIARSKEVKPDPTQTFDENGSAWQYGRDRLFETILRWELWDVAACLSSTPYLEPGRDFDDQWRREQLLALAGYGRGDRDAGQAALERLAAIEARLRAERTDAAAKAEATARGNNQSAAEISKAMADAMQPISEKIETLRRPLAELRLRDHLAHGRTDDAKLLLAEVGEYDKPRLASIQLALGDPAKACEIAKGVADSEKNQLAPWAQLAWMQWSAGRRDEAIATFQEVRRLAGHADSDLPLLRRLAPLAEAAGVAGDWRTPAPAATDTGVRPDLATLGPPQWQAWQAGEWSAVSVAGEPVLAASLRGRAHVVILTLGQACTHCNQQVKAFVDKAAAFEKAGLPIVIVSTDTPTAIRDSGETLPYPVHSGADGAAFRALDAWDDFEGKPLHATCFIAADGRMRWQHVGYEPFMLPDFLLEETRRLLELPENPECLLRR
jgi:peroxiredoxin